MAPLHLTTFTLIFLIEFSLSASRRNTWHLYHIARKCPFSSITKSITYKFCPSHNRRRQFVELGYNLTRIPFPLGLKACFLPPSEPQNIVILTSKFLTSVSQGNLGILFTILSASLRRLSCKLCPHF